MGEIKLTNAQLGRQTKPHPAVEDIVYRHAFLIVEQKRPGVHSSLSRHILCANSDEERDEWVQALMLNIRQGGDNSTSSSNVGTSRADNVGGAGNSSNNGTNTKKATKKGDKARKISKVEIRPVAAAPISHMKPSLGADMDKLTSVPSVNVVPLSSPTLDNHVMDDCKSPTSDSAPEPSPSSSSSATLSTSLPNMHVSPMLGGHYQPQLASPPPPPPPAPPSSQQGSTTPPSTSSTPPPPPPPPPHQTPPRDMPPRRNSTSNVSEAMDDDPARLRQTMGSPIPNAIRSSEDLVLDTGGNNSDVSERRVKQKANRVTMWGKKMFSSGGSSNAEGGAGSPSPSARPSTSSSLAPTDTNDTASRMSSVPSGFRSFLSRSSNDSNERHSEDSNGFKQVFGVPLEDAVRVSRVVEGYELPSVVYRCIEYLDAKKAVMEEGLYRLSGSNMVIQKLKKKFNQGKLHIYIYTKT